MPYQYEQISYRGSREAEMGTKVKNPTHNNSHAGYCKCTGCGKFYTHLGIARHWPKCPAKASAS